MALVGKVGAPPARTRPLASGAVATTVTTIDPGSLAQTRVLPSAHSPAFSAEMSSLWSAVVSGNPSEGQPALFPETAYEQLKAIPNPASDWTSRLLGAYELDIGAAHRLLGSEAATARLVGVNVPTDSARWVSPGRACHNRIGYFEVPNARVVYTVGGQTQSFGIASLISWRGEWYVVHLGSISESSATGTVDDPAIGPGSSASRSTC